MISLTANAQRCKSPTKRAFSGGVLCFDDLNVNSANDQASRQSPFDYNRRSFYFSVVRITNQTAKRSLAKSV